MYFFVCFVSNSALWLHMQVWFKNRRAKFRKGQRCSPLSRDHSLEEVLVSSKMGPEDVRLEDAAPHKNNKTARPLCPPAAPTRVDKPLDACPSSDSGASRCTLRLRPAADFTFVSGERFGHPPHPPVLGVLSTELNLPPMFWPVIQQHGSVVGVHPLSVTKNCSLSLQTAYPSKAAGLPHLGLQL